MADGAKRFPASDIKLQKLRRKGQIPFSLEIQSFGVLIALACIAAFLFDSTASSLKQNLIGKLDGSAASVPSAENVSAALSIYFETALLLLGLIFIVLIVLGIAQTRGLFSIEALKPNLGRFFSWAANLTSSFENLLARSVIYAIKAAAVLSLCFLLGKYSLANWLGEEGLSIEAYESLLTSFNSLFFLVLSALISFALVVAVVSRFIVVLEFKNRHKMTREEVEAEYKETELSSDIRAAQKSFSSGDVE